MTTTPTWICPECKAGKHGNCDGTAWDDDKDDFTTCGCDHGAEAAAGAYVEKHRPPVADRWIEGMRTAPGTISIRTRWLYSDPNPQTVLPEGRTRHPFSRGGDVTASDWPSSYEHMQGIADHVYRAVESFGDDHDVEIEVRLADARAEDNTELRQKARAAASAALDSNVRLLVLSNGTTLDQFNTQFPGILTALANQAADAAFDAVVSSRSA